METIMQHNYQEDLCKLGDEFFAHHPDREGATSKEVTNWAMRTGRLAMSSEDQLQALAKKVSSAFQKEKITDRQGRIVRRKHSALISKVNDEGRETHVHEWSNIESMSYERMVVSVTSRHSYIRDDVEALRDDVGSFNDNHLPNGRPAIQLSFNFDVDDASDSVA